MANYKDIISGAVNKVVGKVKDVAGTVKEAAESGAVRDIYEQGTARAKGYARIAKLNLEIGGKNDELKRLYTEIGQQYYQQAKDAPEGLFVPMFAQAARILEEVHAKEVEIEMLKEGFAPADDDIDVEVVDDFDEVVDGCCCTCTCDEDGTCTCECNGETCTCTCDEDGTCTCECNGEICTCSCDDNCCTAEDFVDCCCDKAENVVEKIEDVVENICDKVEEKIECCCDKVEEKIDCCCNKTED